MNTPQTLTILCGGKSRRMGEDKALLAFKNEALLTRHIRLAQAAGLRVQVATGGTHYDLPADVLQVTDKLPLREGPLSALAGALMVCKANAQQGTWLMPVDTLITPAQLIHALANKLSATGALIVHEGQPQPLFAFYSTDLLPRIEQWLDDGIRQMMPLAAITGMRQVAMPDEWIGLDNFNTSEQWQHAQQTLTQQLTGEV